MGKKSTITRREFLREGAVAVGAGLVALEALKSAEVLAQEKALKPRYGFLIDLTRCKGCFACAVACKEEFDVPLGVFRSQVILQEKGEFPKVKRFFLPWLCNHCEAPVCISQCPVEPKKAVYVSASGERIEYNKRATYKRPDGLVLVDNGLIDSTENRCIGCGACVALCPYQVRFLIDTDDGPKASKCSLCVHRLDVGEKPACVEACPHSARVCGNLNDPESEISRALREAEAAGKGVATLATVRYRENNINTNPRCFYIGLEAKDLNELYKTGECIKDEAREKLQEF